MASRCMAFRFLSDGIARAPTVPRTGADFGFGLYSAVSLSSVLHTYITNSVLQPNYNTQVFYVFLQKTLYWIRWIDRDIERNARNQPRGATRCFTLFTGCAFAQNPSLEDQLDRAPLTLEVGKSPSDRYATAS